MAKKLFNILIIFLSVVGTIPLAILGLLTPYVFVAFMLGISDIIFVVIISLNAYCLGVDNREG